MGDQRTRFFGCFCLWLAFFALQLFFLLDQQVEVMQLRLAIPLLEREVQQMHQENLQLLYEIERFESPDHLMELAKGEAFQHLHYPYVDDVLLIP